MTRSAIVSTAGLVRMLTEVRRSTLKLIADLTDEQMIGPRLDIVNPLRWEIGHLAWFQEKWTLGNLRGRSSLLAESDVLYDSAAIAHDTRWDLRLPSREKTLDYMDQVLNRVVETLDGHDASQEEIYFHLLAIFHEDMHDEAMTYTRQTLSYPRPQLDLPEDSGHVQAIGGPLPGDVEVPAATFLLGATKDEGFVFDNEKWAHTVFLNSFCIARAPVTNAEFASFIDEGGYTQRRWWSDAGWAWRVKAQAGHPFHWEPASGGKWLEKHFDAFLPLEDDLPVIHVNWYEADAYCRWAGRRLPTEAEWELAASGEPTEGWGGVTDRKRKFPWGNDPPDPTRANLDFQRMGRLEVGALPDSDSAFGCRQMIGNTWEWTSSDFLPYPAFLADPYKEYSQPWFHTHKVLRGGCWTTRSRLIRNTWRNFYTPDRRDVWAGFRTCSL
jgi:iron(II)-dependent oxidoreductase